MRRSRLGLSHLERCYACDAVATSREHVPAQAFYPKPSELGPSEKRRNYRTGLITVPSCELHNNAKSRDENYAIGMIIVLSGLFIASEVPDVPVPPFFRKWFKHVKQGIRMRHTIETATAISTLGPDGEPLGGTMTLESHAIDKTVEMMARALYYYHVNHERRWPAVCVVRNMHTIMADLRTPPGESQFSQMEAVVAEFERRGDPRGARRGPHPDIFFYQVVEPQEGLIVMRLVFYQFFRFMVLGRNTADAPPPSHAKGS